MYRKSFSKTYKLAARSHFKITDTYEYLYSPVLLARDPDHFDSSNNSKNNVNLNLTVPCPDHFDTSAV